MRRLPTLYIRWWPTLCRSYKKLAIKCGRPGLSCQVFEGRPVYLCYNYGTIIFVKGVFQVPTRHCLVASAIRGLRNRFVQCPCFRHKTDNNGVRMFLRAGGLRAKLCCPASQVVADYTAPICPCAGGHASIQHLPRLFSRFIYRAAAGVLEHLSHPGAALSIK